MLPRWLHWLPALVVVALLAGAATAYWLDRGDPTDPARIAPPAGLDLPPLTPPSPVAATSPVGAGATPDAVRRAVAPLLRDRHLGRHVVIAVARPDGTPLLTSGSGTVTPASTLKLFTSAAALETLGPDHRFVTQVVSDAPGRIVLVGGGDPLLASTRPDPEDTLRRADVVTLARATARALKAAGRTRVRLGFDDTLFAGPAVSRHWPPGYIPDGVVAPIQALWVDEGRPGTGFGRVADPAATAAAVFGKALAQAGITVVGVPQRRKAAADAAGVAQVASPPLFEIVEHTLEVSDNEAAEVLARQVAVATGVPPTFEGGASAVRTVLADLGVPTTTMRTYDGSGLSRDNRVEPATLTALLAAAGSADHAELRWVLEGLPVAGFTGSLGDRFVGDTGRGWVRAKTGTLTNVSGLAGTVTDSTGNPMVFAVLADRIAKRDTLDAEAALDDVASALATCRCGG